MDRCQQFRDQWLERALDGAALEAWMGTSEHVPSCAECAEWVQSTATHVAALSGMPRLELPGALEAHVQGDLDDPTAQVERALRSMEPMPAPPELELAVAALLGRRDASDDVREHSPDRRPGGGLVRALDYSTVPPVLDRLVSEELEHADARVVERFVGNLERETAPAKLEQLVASSFRPSVFARVATIASVAAACLVVWLATRPSDERQPRRLRVVRADSLSQLEPVARGLLEALGGGVGGASATERPHHDGAPPSTLRAPGNER